MVGIKFKGLLFIVYIMSGIFVGIVGVMLVGSVMIVDIFCIGY